MARREQRGFTLVEVLVALAIVAAALASIAVTMGRMQYNAQLMRDRTYASWIAQNRIVQVRAEGVLPEPGSSDGEMEFAGLEWEWEMEIDETGVENLLRIDVSVSRPGEDDSIKTVTGFIGEPALPGLANSLWVQAAGAAGDAGGPDGGDDGGPGGDPGGDPADDGGDDGDFGDTQ
jgi:general secretion pathway protein I